MLSGQGVPQRPFEPNIPNGLNPNWYETCFEDGQNMLGDGYNSFYSFGNNLSAIFDDNLFMITSRNSDLGYIGFTLDKRNLDDGRLLWRRNFGLLNHELIDLPRHMYLNEEGNVEIFSQTFPPDSIGGVLQFGSNKAVFKFRVIDGGNGQLIEENGGISFDTSSFFSVATWLLGLTIDSYKRLGKDSYEFYALKQNSIEKTHSLSLVSSGCTKETASTKSIPIKNTGTVLPAINIGGKEYLLFERLVNSTSLVFRKANDKFEIIKEDTILLTGMGSSNMRIIKTDTLNRTFLLEDRVYFDDFNKRSNIYWINFNGEILKKWEVPINYSNLTLINGAPDNFTFLSTYSSTDRFLFKMSIIKLDSDERVNIVNEFVFQDSLRVNSNYTIIEVPDKDEKILIWAENSYYISDFGNVLQDISARAISVCKVENSRLLTSTLDYSTQNADIRIFPNPVENILSIHFGNTMEGKIEIFDILGKKIECADFENGQDVYVDVSNFENGIYFLTIKDDQQNTFRPIKFMKL